MRLFVIFNSSLCFLHKIYWMYLMFAHLNGQADQDIGTVRYKGGAQGIYMVSLFLQYRI